MRFEYRLTGLGWADGSIQINDQTCNFGVSYMIDALGDLLQALVYLIPTCVPEEEGRDQVTFEWDEEPAGTVWTLTQVAEGRIHVQIVSYTDLQEQKNPVTQLDAEVQAFDLVRAIIWELDGLIKTHGIVGFRETWYNHDFPLAYFLKLKHYVTTQTAYDVTKYEDRGCALAKTDLEQDLLLLQQHPLRG